MAKFVKLGFKPIGPSVLAGVSPVKVAIHDTDAASPLLSVYDPNETVLRAAIYRFLAKQKLYPHFCGDVVRVCKMPNGFGAVGEYLFWVVEE